MNLWSHTGEHHQVLHTKKYRIFPLNMLLICISAFSVFYFIFYKKIFIVQTQMQNPMQMNTFLYLSFPAMHSIFVLSKSPSDQWVQGPHIMKVSMTQDPVSLISKWFTVEPCFTVSQNNTPPPKHLFKSPQGKRSHFMPDPLMRHEGAALLIEGLHAAPWGLWCYRGALRTLTNS